MSEEQLKTLFLKMGKKNQREFLACAQMIQECKSRIRTIIDQTQEQPLVWQVAEVEEAA